MVVLDCFTFFAGASYASPNIRCRLNTRIFPNAYLHDSAIQAPSLWRIPYPEREATWASLQPFNRCIL